jgi:uncharacterized YigZ family protein
MHHGFGPHTKGNMTRYRIPANQVRTEIRVSNSRFITTVSPVSSVKEAQAFIRKIREEMPDASHHVYAFKIGYGSSVSEGMSDAGEPSGTSGPPALAVLRGADIGDTVLVITRYFGGTKLGTGGLVSAYTHAAKFGIEALDLIEKVDRSLYAIRAPYAAIKSIRKLIAEHDGVIEHEQFDESVHIRLKLPTSMETVLDQAIKTATSGMVSLSPVDDSPT